MDIKEAKVILRRVFEVGGAQDALEVMFAKLRTDQILKLSTGKPPSGDVMAEGVEMTKFKAIVHGLTVVETALKQAINEE